MDLSIIIINYNTNQYTLQCIRSIYEQTKNIEFEIIVIDNNSQKESANQILKEYPSIKLIKNSENIGFGRANNQGIAMAKGRYILLLNSDTIILENALEKCIRFMDSDFARDNNIGLVGCRLLNEDLSQQNSVFAKGSLLSYFFHSNPFINKFIRPNKNLSLNKSQFVSGVSGAFMLFRKEVFKVVKPFDPDIFMYSEETELCRNRVSKHFNIYYWREAKVIHLGGKSSKGNSSYYQNVLSFSLYWYKKGFLLYLFYITIFSFNWLSHLILYPLVSVFNKKSINLYKRFIISYLKVCPYLFIEIPRYSKNWGSRPSPLILK